MKLYEKLSLAQAQEIVRSYTSPIEAEIYSCKHGHIDVIGEGGKVKDRWEGPCCDIQRKAKMMTPQEVMALLHHPLVEIVSGEEDREQDYDYIYDFAVRMRDEKQEDDAPCCWEINFRPNPTKALPNPA